MAEFDQAARYLIRRNPRGCCAWLSAPFVAAWTFRGWIDTSNLAFPGEPDRLPDTVAEFVSRASPARRCLLDIEVQSYPDVDMLERQGEYAFRLRRERRYGRGRSGKYQVVSVLLNLTGAVQPYVLDMTEQTLDGGGLRLQVVQRTLREEDAVGTLARIAAGELERCILPWVVLMRGAGRSDIIEEWRRLALQEPEERRRSEYGGLALIFSDPTRHGSAWDRALEGWNMLRSRHIMEWQAQAEARRARDFLLRTLRVRFQAVPPDMETAIAAQNNLDELTRLFDVALTAPSLDVFRSALEQ
jgi:hypothetical protein